MTVYEISDFQCPFCARFFLETMPSLEREYVVPEEWKFVFVNLPLPMHPNAVPAAELAMCAARQGNFCADARHPVPPPAAMGRPQ